MATLDTARAVKSVAFDRILELVGLRPNAVGVVADGHGGFALKVVLPRDPGGDIPSELLDVPLIFHVSQTPPTLAASGAPDDPVPGWLKRSKERRAKR